MKPSRLIPLALSAGWWSGLLSAASLVMASRSGGDGPLTGINAPSHWFFGESAAHQQRFSLRHTLVGALTHQGSSFFWGVLYAASRARPAAREHGGLRITAEAALFTLCAAGVDLVLVPKRLTPGFERRLSSRALTGVYAAFALGLAVAALRAPRTDAQA